MRAVESTRANERKTAMPIYEVDTESIKRLKETSFHAAGFEERSDLQRLLREKWSYPGLADGLSVAIQSAARATSLEVFSKFIGERYPSAECRRWRLYQPSMY